MAATLKNRIDQLRACADDLGIRGLNGAKSLIHDVAGELEMLVKPGPHLSLRETASLLPHNPVRCQVCEPHVAAWDAVEGACVVCKREGVLVDTTDAPPSNEIAGMIEAYEAIASRLGVDPSTFDEPLDLVAHVPLPMRGNALTDGDLMQIRHLLSVLRSSHGGSLRDDIEHARALIGRRFTGRLVEATRVEQPRADKPDAEPETLRVVVYETAATWAHNNKPVLGVREESKFKGTVLVRCVATIVVPPRPPAPEVTVEGECLASELLDQEPGVLPVEGADGPPRVPVSAADRGTLNRPCEYCGNTRSGATLENGWYRCNECGEPSP